jgi:hypothetical protein
MSGIICWAVDPLVKVFRENEPGEGKIIEIEAARNEFESGQIALRCDRDARVSLQPSKLTNSSTGLEISPVARFVGYVFVRQNATSTPDDEIIHAAPHDFPDILMPDTAVELDANQTQPVWITVFVPQSADPGEYIGRVVVRAADAEESVEIHLTVHGATVPDERHLFLTNWINPTNIAKFAGVDPWSEGHWQLLGKHAENMALHRQNVVLTPISLVRISRRGENLEFDFTDFDRWIQTFRDAGVDGLIEGGHLGGRAGKWESGFNLNSWEIRDGNEIIRTPAVAVESAECESFLSKLLPALRKHLVDRGWIDSYVQHLADEPVEENAQSYRHLAELVGRFAPGLKRIDANMTPSLTDCLEVWVPVLDQFDKNMDFYNERLQAGDQVWFYTCLGPRGRYPNRFIDFSLIKTRLLHWINFRYGLSGYLHWGYNYWTEDPIRDTQPDWSHGEPLPSGDMCIVYPGPDGPLESIRYEAMRDGIEDYELLKLLYGQDPEEAMKICSEGISTPTDYIRDAGKFRELRSKLLCILDRLVD